MKKYYVYYLFLLAVLLISIFSSSCNEELPKPTSSYSNLTIEDAKNYFNHELSQAQNLIGHKIGPRSDSEVVSNELNFIIDWINGEVHFDTLINKTVVDVPIISGPLSYNVIFDANQSIDTPTASSFLTLTNYRLIVTKDTSGTLDYAIMKIIGSYKYFSNINNYALNTYRHIESNFNGSICFVDIYDQPLAIYKIINGERFRATNYTTTVLEAHHLQPRWEIICIKFYEEIPCPCEGHSTGEHCTCPTRPRRIVYEICWEVGGGGGGGGGSSSGSGTGGNGWGWSSGGGGGGGSTVNNPVNGYISNINNFKNKFGIDLLDENYEDYALMCKEEGGDFEQCVLISLAKLKHTQLTTTYSNYSAENINIDNFISLNGAETYLAAAILYEKFMNEINAPPTDPYIYQLLMEQFLKTVGSELMNFVPFVGAYQDFNSGHYFMGSVSLILDLSAPLKTAEVIKNADKIGDAWKIYKTLKSVVIKIIDAGGNKILDNLPQSWKTQASREFIEESTISKGWQWTNPNNSNHHLRAMSGNPSSPYPHSRNPYYKMHKGNFFHDKYGTPVDPSNFSGGVDDPVYNSLIHIPIAEAIESNIINFFN